LDTAHPVRQAFRVHSPRGPRPSHAGVVRRALVGLALTIGLLATSTLPASAALHPLPTCRYADVLTKYRLTTDWSRTLVDTTYMLPSSYKPVNLTSTANAGLNGGYYVRPAIIEDLRLMASAARAAGARLAVQSAYRSYYTQRIVFQNEVKIYGYARALTQSARPGHSEHQIGTSLDFRSYYSTTAPWLYTDWGTTKAGSWLKANAWKYGFIMSYPKGKSTVTCYTYEPWHYRYVGRAMAKSVRESGLTLREYLWYRRGNGYF
jgi:D-alanyl-D-alanine carboxypeptidase